MGVPGQQGQVSIYGRPAYPPANDKEKNWLHTHTYTVKTSVAENGTQHDIAQAGGWAGGFRLKDQEK